MAAAAVVSVPHPTLLSLMSCCRPASSRSPRALPVGGRRGTHLAPIRNRLSLVGHELTTTNTNPSVSANFQQAESFFGRPPRFERGSLLNKRAQGRLHSTAAQLTDNEANTAKGVVRGIDKVGDKNWFQTALPEQFWPYAQLVRLDKPIGITLFTWPLFWSAFLALPQGEFLDVKTVGWFLLWGAIIRSAACTVNDICDCEFDAKVERTRSRPIPSGALNVFQASSFLAFQLVLALGLLLPVNNLSRVLGLAYILINGIYPLMKRWIHLPAAYLGFAVYSGAYVGWAVVNSNLDLSVLLPMHASGVFWALVADTIYGQQDKKDDAKIGVKSTALLFGSDVQVWLTGFSIASAGLLALAGWNCGLGWPFYVGVAAAFGQLLWQVSADPDDPADCKEKFMSNFWYCLIVFSAVLVGKTSLLLT